jgi:predicted oxidoreductase
MESIPLGTSSLQTTRLGYGCWRLGGSEGATAPPPNPEATGKRAVIAAFEAGFRFFDHADIYCGGRAELIFAQALKEVAGMRDQIVIASKCGIRFAGEPAADAPYRYDSSAEYIIRSCEGSLQRLGIDRIDLYQIHRPDFLGNPEEIASAFCRLKESGKVREFGVSNFLPHQLAAVQKACPMPLIVNQVEISLLQLSAFHDGTLEQCMAEKMTPLAWSPLGGGVLGARERITPPGSRQPAVTALHDEIDSIAGERHVSRSVICLAWLLKHPSRIVPLVGSVEPTRIRDAAAAPALELTREEWYRLLTAARGARLS